MFREDDMQELTKEEKVGALWLMHFGEIFPEEADCSQCADFKADLCKGEKVPVKCMVEKSQKSEVALCGGESPIPKETLIGIGEIILKFAGKSLTNNKPRPYRANKGLS